MIADTLDNPPRSLVQYAEELRAEYQACLDKLSAIDNFPAYRNYVAELDRLRKRLLAVEREINWRMGI